MAWISRQACYEEQLVGLSDSEAMYLGRYGYVMLIDEVSYDTHLTVVVMSFPTYLKYWVGGV